MDIYVNGNKVDYTPLFPLTWNNFFQKLLQGHIPKDHGIVEISVDGVDSLNLMMEDSHKMVQENVGTVKVGTKDSVAITKGGISKVYTLIESIKGETNQAADLFREGKIPEASGKVAKIMEAIKPMINFINSVGMGFSMNFDELMFDLNTPLRERLEGFVNSLNEMVVVQEKKDYVELADYLEYQLNEDMDDWAKVADLLMKEIEASKSKPH